MAPEFCDTNVIVYAFDASAGDKRDRAKMVLDRLWAYGEGVVSVQVLQELFVTLTKKVPGPLSTANARMIIADFSTWRVVEPTRGDVLAAIDGMTRWNVSFWDAMVLTSANKAGAAVIWSEDLNHGQTYDEVRVQNPFLHSPNP